ncbi:response regulator [uncultured Xylophilus sp.]|uniref:response regulator transcription factor n=1 Tax=uncultured Xylophilus sp. TaxID=296832 RepID=UPI00260061DF|nr:response regulator [uncultured Xylophilus sp.]
MAKKILLVEDQPDIRRLIRMTLEFENYDITEAATAAEGAQLFTDLQPDLLLLDVMTPGGMDGLELCRKVRSHHDDLYRPAIVMLTARGQQQDIDAGIAVGADAYLVKPFSPLQLLDTVSGMLAT